MGHVWPNTKILNPQQKASRFKNIRILWTGPKKQVRLQGLLKTEGLIKDDNSLHVDMYQTLLSPKLQRETIDLGFLQNVNADTQIVKLLVVLFYSQSLRFVRFELFYHNLPSWISAPIASTRCNIHEVENLLSRPAILDLITRCNIYEVNLLSRPTILDLTTQSLHSAERWQNRDKNEHLKTFPSLQSTYLQSVIS